MISSHEDDNIYDFILHLTKSLWVNLPHKAACVILFSLITPDYYTRNAIMGSKERVCWICDRRFTSGRALGGHQKSHYSLLPIPSKTRGQQLHVVYPDPTLRSDIGNSIGRRSKYRHAAPTKDNENTPRVTSGHEVLSDKEAARCLLMLSMGNGLVKKLSHGKSIIVDAAPTTEVFLTRVPSPRSSMTTTTTTTRRHSTVRIAIRCSALHKGLADIKESTIEK